MAELRKEPGKDLVILGSGALTRSLMRHGLVDDYVLLIHPLVLGTGQRLFDEGSPTTTLLLAEATTTGTGVVVATYRTADGAGNMSQTRSPGPAPASD